MQSAYSGILCWSVQDEQSRADDDGRKEVIRFEIAINRPERGNHEKIEHSNWWWKWVRPLICYGCIVHRVVRCRCASLETENEMWIFCFILSFVDASHSSCLVITSVIGRAEWIVKNILFSRSWEFALWIASMKFVSIQFPMCDFVCCRCVCACE